MAKLSFDDKYAAVALALFARRYKSDGNIQMMLYTSAAKHLSSKILGRKQFHKYFEDNRPEHTILNEVREEYTKLDLDD